jgi:outer membrane protein assembly factor BamB
MVELLADFDAAYHLAGTHGDTFYVLTDRDAPRGRVVAFDLDRPDQWREVVAETADTIETARLVGGRNALIVSFDKRTGEERWRALSDPGVGYCPPVIFEYGGERQLIVWSPRAVVGLRPENGQKLWEVPFDVQSGLSIPTPRKLDNRLFVTSFYNGPLMIDLSTDGRSPRVLWRSAEGNNERVNDSLHAIMCTPIVTEQHIFGVGSYGELRCLETDSGKVLWETREATGQGRWWNAFLVPHEDRVFLCNEQGELIIAKLDGEGYHEISRAQLLEPTAPIQRRMTVWSHPAFAMKSIFARNDKELIRVDLSAP